MTDIYTPEEFAECFWRRGYGKKKCAVEWIAANGLSSLAEDDFMRCYHDTQQEMILPRHRKYIARRTDGQNPSAPQNQPNSCGATFAQLIRSEERAIERAKARHKAAKECGVGRKEVIT